MNDYVDINTLYSSIQERTVENLSKIYDDLTELKSVVHQLWINHFTISDIEGKSVLLKPNWVRHEIVKSDYRCLRTNDNLLLCVLEEILYYSPSRVLIADAPIQSCIWERMITKEFLSKIETLSDHFGISVEVKDFRRTIYYENNNKVQTDLHPESDYVFFDLGSDSYLEPITTPTNRFRVTCYDPDIIAEAHHRGVHKYCLAKEVFEYDVIITVPKIKTHRMAGMTNALKLLVGISGDKSFLPHHRIGSLSEGGDNYENSSILRTISNRFIDDSNRRRGTSLGCILNMIGSQLWKLSRPDCATLINAGWHGNDTIWRTVMDINRIAQYGDSNGHIHDSQQRQLFVIMDGVIGGQGDGPLSPIPAPLGVLAISNNPFLMDVVAGELYHLKSEKIPLLNEASKFLYNNRYSITVNSRSISMDEVKEYGIDILMPPGWEGYCYQKD